MVISEDLSFGSSGSRDLPSSPRTYSLCYTDYPLLLGDEISDGTKDGTQDVAGVVHAEGPFICSSVCRKGSENVTSLFM